MPRPVEPASVGALFFLTSDAVVLLEGEQVVAWNAAAERLFGVPEAEAVAPGARPLGPHLPVLLALDVDAPPVRLSLAPDRVVSAVRRCVDERALLLLRDVTADVRREEGLRRIAGLSGALLAGGTASLPGVLQSLCTEAKELTGAAYSALLLLREGSSTESSHFAYDAPRYLFPERMPRAVGLLAVPLATRQVARLDDIRGHPAGVGLPGVHPPIGPLLAVPLLAGDEPLGELAVARAPDGAPFDEVDESLMVDLAAHAAVAVAWAKTAERERERAVVRQEVVDTARHDVRTPLGAGKGFAQLLQRRRERMSPEQVDVALQGLVDSFERIEAFSARLLLDERTAEAGVEPVWGSVDVDALLAAVQRDAEALSGRSGVLAWSRDDAPDTLAGDPEMVREVLDNLVGNALKHAGSARITVRLEGEHVRFDVRDDGPGIPEAEQDLIFDRWSRTQRSRQEGTEGFGLGLAIVKRLVTAHGGALGVSSRPSEGATFWVTFPRTAPDAAGGPA